MFEKFQKAFNLTKEEELHQALQKALTKKECEKFCIILNNTTPEEIKRFQTKTEVCEAQKQDLEWQIEELGFVNQKIPGKIARFKRAILAVLNRN